MKKSKRLAVLAKLAGLYEKQQLARLQVAQTEELRHRQALDQLAEYREEYETSALSNTSTELQSGILQNFSRFMADLGAASTLQQQQLEGSESVSREEARQWQLLYSREEAMQQLVENARRDERFSEEKRRALEMEDQWAATTQRHLK